MAKIQDISIQNPIYHWIKVANGSVALTEIVTNKSVRVLIGAYPFQHHQYRNHER
ncbi:MAG: hypothetical protein ACRC76_11590 [Proteocatella sp.]